MSAEVLVLKKEIRVLRSQNRLGSFKRFVESVRTFKKSKLDTDLNCQKKFIKLWNVVKPTLEIALCQQVSDKSMSREIQDIICKGDSIMCNKKINVSQISDFRSQLSKLFSKIEKKLE